MDIYVYIDAEGLYYGIDNSEALSLVKRCKSVCTSWNTRAAQLGISCSEQEMMAPAFSC